MISPWLASPVAPDLLNRAAGGRAAMVKIETIRLRPRARRGGGSAAAADGALTPRLENDADEPELLDMLASGQPPAFASDSRDRIVFWNRGAVELLGRRAEDVLGRRCYEVTRGRDIFGNRFCYANCPVTAALRDGERVRGFELDVTSNGHGRTLAKVTILRIPSVRPDLFTVVHILQPIEESSRLSRALRRLGAVRIEETPPGSPASPPPQLAGADAPALTAREREILGCVAAGLQNKEVAQRLDLSVATVRNHIHNILEKLRVHSKLEAVCLAFRRGWVEDDRPAEVSTRPAV